MYSVAARGFACLKNDHLQHENDVFQAGRCCLQSPTEIKNVVLILNANSLIKQRDVQVSGQCKVRSLVEFRHTASHSDIELT
jgi:hypothetical protein